MTRDPDLDGVSFACRKDESADSKDKVSCAPPPIRPTPGWTAIDHFLFIPAHDALTLPVPGEALDVNALDEVPDSSWFANRMGLAGDSGFDPSNGACSPHQLLDPSKAEPGTYLIDAGKSEGATAGFRVKVPEAGKFMFKADPKDQPEVPTAATVIGTAIYYAVGFHTPCEQLVYVDPKVFTLKPGLTFRHSPLVDPKPFDQAALEEILKTLPRKGPLYRMQASAWLPGHTLGNFYYQGVRADDPNDVVPHEMRRPLRGARLVAAWLDHIDSRDANSITTWMADDPKNPLSSPGRIMHYYIDTSDSLGPNFGPDQGVNRRLGFAYVIDWPDTAVDLFSLGIVPRPWDTIRVQKGYENFRTYDVEHFVADEWKMQYPNPAFDSMTERDGAWMARILARFSREMVRNLAKMGQLTGQDQTDYLAYVMQGRLDRILARYLTRLSPLGEVAVEHGDTLCATDLAALREVRPASEFSHSASMTTPQKGTLRIEDREHARVCTTLPHVARDGGERDDSASRYVTVRLENNVSKGPLLAHLYDLGPTRGYKLVALERPRS